MSAVMHMSHCGLTFHEKSNSCLHEPGQKLFHPICITLDALPYVSASKNILLSEEDFGAQLLLQ